MNGALAPSLSSPAAGLTRLSLLDRIAILGIAAQFAVMVTISYVLWERHGLTGDFAGFFHGWSSIARGDLNPWQQDAANMRYLQNHGELITYLFAPVYWLIPNGFGLRLIQDSSAAGISIVSWLWVRELLASARLARTLALPLGLTALVLIVLDPWPIWSNAFDFHWQATGTFFMLAAAYAFFRRNLVLGFAACILTVLTGDVMATILAGLGLSMLFVGRVRLAGAGVLLLAVGSFFLIHRLGGGLGYAASGGGLEMLYGDLFAPEHPHDVTAAGLIAFMLTHPQNVLAALARNGNEIYANLAPAGLVGVFYPWSWGVCLVTLLENDLANGRLFAQPSFQSFPLYAFTAVGTSALLVALASRERAAWPARIACALLSLNALAWAAVWLPHIPSRWILVRPNAAAELTRINRTIPWNQEVIGGEAFLGLFADRPVYYNSIHPDFPLDTNPVNVVIAPYDGVNALTANADLSRIAALGRRPGARLVSHNDGVWWFSYAPKPGERWLPLPMGAERIPAWTLDGISGRATLEGPEATWRIEYAGERGDVFENDYWRVPVGRYNAVVDIESDEQVILEVRN
ncbi:MAG: DUF2079 domain-containing protein, partial [Candidatus Eremiobacteraeota bacterium]|nr:DUF2079 domain-containing protein [Candidatus Eremiobacteraeota bacterium]